MSTRTGNAGVDAEKKPTDQILRIGLGTPTDTGRSTGADTLGRIGGEPETILPWTAPPQLFVSCSMRLPVPDPVRSRPCAWP